MIVAGFHFGADRCYVNTQFKNCVAEIGFGSGGFYRKVFEQTENIGNAQMRYRKCKLRMHLVIRPGCLAKTSGSKKHRRKDEDDFFHEKSFYCLNIDQMYDFKFYVFQNQYYIKNSARPGSPMPLFSWMQTAFVKLSLTADTKTLF
jgi:hypothetical protein